MKSTLGHTRPFEPYEVLENGGWQAEIRNDEIADISFHGIPVLRAIRAVVRDQDWRTLAPKVTRSIRRAGPEGTELQLDIEFAGYGCRYQGCLTVQFGPASLSVAFDGVAPANFRSNRIGLVVLHRPDESGRLVTIHSPVGVSTPSSFPTDISPHQPFLDVESMRWERDGAEFSLDFSGDVFETEDQRNWTDASFKTYSTPLSRPFPVDVRKGDRVHQSVVLTASAPAGQRMSAASSAAADTPRILAALSATVPALAVSAATTVDAPTPAIQGLEALLFEVAATPDLDAVLQRALEQSSALAIPLDVRLVVNSPGQIPWLLARLPLSRVIRLGVFDSATHVTKPDLWDALKLEAVRLKFAGTLLAGARSHFTELNRSSSVIPADAPALTYSITPQMHATEVPHIVETLPMQSLTAINASRISSGKPLHIGPITLKPRFNAVATAANDPAGSASDVDGLQDDPFTAAWLLGSIAALTVPGVAGLSYFEAAGPKGIGGPDGLTPAGKLLAALASFRGKPVLPVEDTPPGLVLYPVHVHEGLILFAANLTRHPIQTCVTLPQGKQVEIRVEPWSANTTNLQKEVPNE